MNESKRTGHRKQRNGKAGRPVTLTMPEPIPDTPENVAQAMMRTPPRKKYEWEFLQQHKEAANGASGG